MAFPTITTPATGGDFAGANGTTLQAASANWNVQSGTNSNIVTDTGQGKVSASTYAEYGYHVDPGSEEVEAYLTIATKPTGNRTNGIWISVYSGTAPASSSADRDGYQIEIDTSTTVSDLVLIQKKIDGSNVGTAASTTAVTFAAGEKIGFRISTSGGSRVIEVFRFTAGSWNQTPILTATDAGGAGFGGSVAAITTVNSFGFGMTDSAAGPGRIDDLVLGATVSGGTDATATSPALTGLGDFPVPTFQAGATVTTPAADGLGDFPAGEMQIGVDVTAPALTGLGDFPVPAVSGTGDSTVTTPAADGLGDFPPPTLQYGNTVAVPAHAALGDFPVPTVTGTVSGSIQAVPADAAGRFPAPTVTPLVSRLRNGNETTGGTLVFTPRTGGTEVSASLTGGNEPAYATGGNPAAYHAGGVEVELVGA